MTVHFVDEGVDSGPIVLQESFELPYHRDIAAIEQRFHEVEHRLLPRAVRLIAAGRVRVDERIRGSCTWRPMAEPQPPASEPAAPGEVRIRRALLSVSDKRGLVDFARGLVELGVEIVSTGGTARELEEAGIDTRPVEDYTGFPEILDGRVKTLNPRIYAGLLAVRSDDGAHRDAQRARGRADRPGVREPLSVRARVGPARGGGRRGDREHRHRRSRR